MYLGRRPIPQRTAPSGGPRGRRARREGPESLHQPGANRGRTLATADNGAERNCLGVQAEAIAASATGDKRKHPPTILVGGCQVVGATGLEPVTPSVSSWCSSQLS